MNKTKFHKIQVRNKPGTEDQPLTGANCELLVDGKPLKGARSFKLEVNAKSLAVATVEFYGLLEVDVLGELQSTEFFKPIREINEDSGIN